jgi:prepilin-type N-terminal cleavage/methylation domain-containing protein
MHNPARNPPLVERIPPIPRRGVTMLELLAAIALFSTVALLVVPVLGRVAAVRDEAAAHSTALREAANVMERVAARSARRELTEPDLNSLALSDTAVDNLTAPQLRVTLGEPEGEPSARQLTVAVSWENEAGQRGTPVTLTRYLYGAGAAP